MINVKRTTIEIPTNTLIKIKTLAVKEGKTQNNIINELINKGLEKKNKTTADDKSKETAIERIDRITNGKAKILNKNSYKQNKSDSIKGIIKAPKGFDPVKAVEDTY
jgi:predicted DNA-binding protein